MTTSEYVEHIAKGMRQSAVCLTLFTENYKTGTESLLQFALAMMLDKPILLLVKRGTTIPQNVRKVAQRIEFFDEGNPDSLADASKRLLDIQQTPPSPGSDGGTCRT